jgi:glycosyltransferase involved in cell wall biosynthesis
MHIAYLTSEYPNARVTHAAGIATSIKNLAVVLVEKGVEVSVIVYHQKEDAVYVEHGVTIHLIQSRRFKSRTFYKYRKFLQNYLNDLTVKENIDIIEAPDWTGITAFMRLKAPLVIRFHGSDAYFCKLDDRKQKFKNFLFEKLALRQAKAFIAPTAFAGKETAKIFGLNKSKIKTIHYGLQLDKFINSTPQNYKYNNILYIGTIIRKKGVFELAEIFNKVITENPEATLTLIGGDSKDIKSGNVSTFKLMEDLFSTKAKKQVSYLGKIPYVEVQNHIKKAHVCVFPSFAETLGMVTIESMALKKPVVNTSIGWAQELIDNGINGYLVHPTDTDLYAKRILDIFNNNAKALEIGKAARKQVEAKFDIAKNAEINIAYYKTLL